ncbi:MAG: DUF4124 domain-containing protein [Gammaproteobacteria bacterium]|nr:DUF4124 domain-containing protein [Gammaproteobacteria bacterium]MCW8840573.1 DUF4124 domain-containing protein [Gammaproteobacteria bacterium]MCW8927544.1 DUF4124 domain-containing protein [Gammaproteobacteria bacterium]MCW8958884.1 DUF4124 domain-containing protein [Gammaproteobacteria bacterium]MCW8973327.1 DUF4124 domain-containing protein [Gammaproteobacteria bacterium]
MQKTFLIGCLLGSALLMPLHGQAAIKCWTNNEGVRECGNAIPPEYAQQESETLNKRGMTVDVQKRAKTGEELEEERRRRAEEEQRRAEQERLRKEQANYDRVLLSTFLSEQEIIEARDRKISAIDATIELNRITVEKHKVDLQHEQQRAENYRQRERAIPENLQQSIDSLERQITDKNRYIKSQQEEKARLELKYQQDLERFRELKASGRRLH